MTESPPAAADQDGRPPRQEVRLQVSALRVGESPRLAGVDEEHARLLAGVAAELPPILVHRRTMQIVDGAHRLRAAVLRGDREISAWYVDGDEAETFVRAVRANLAHGLPLSRAEREAAAARIVALRPEWSDRAVATASGLPRGAVRRLRERSTGPVSQSNTRLGRDGRVRPVDAVAGRLAASRVLGERPQASVREVAQLAGVSVGTAHDVRARLRQGEDPVPPGLRRQASTLGSMRGPRVPSWGPRVPSWGPRVPSSGRGGLRRRDPRPGPGRGTRWTARLPAGCSRLAVAARTTWTRPRPCADSGATRRYGTRSAAGCCCGCSTSRQRTRDAGERSPAPCRPTRRRQSPAWPAAAPDAGRSWPACWTRTGLAQTALGWSGPVSCRGRRGRDPGR